jgi:hypothetical protein
MPRPAHTNDEPVIAGELFTGGVTAPQSKRVASPLPEPDPGARPHAAAPAHEEGPGRQ